MHLSMFVQGRVYSVHAILDRFSKIIVQILTLGRWASDGQTPEDRVIQCVRACVRARVHARASVRMCVCVLLHKMGE